MLTARKLTAFVAVFVVTGWLPAALNAAGAAKSKESEPSNLAKYLDWRAAKLTAAAKPPTKPADWEQRRDDLRKKYLAMLGLDPMPEKTPLNARMVGEPLDVAQSLCRRVIFESRPKSYIAAHLYVPKAVQTPAPAIIYVPGHGKRDHYHQHPLSYAAHGYVALNMPALGDEGRVGGGMGCGHKGPYYDNYQWYNTGYNPAGVEVWDTIRAVDYLLSLRDEKTGKPLVDPQRIGLSGRSGGAARTLWTFVAEPRIAAAVPAEGFTTVADYRRSIANTCDVHLFYNYYGLTYGELYGLAAPRCMLAQHGTTDRLYPNYQGVARYLAALYAAIGKPECFAHEVFEQGHADTPELRRSEYAWFDRWLGKGRPGVTPIADEPVPDSLRNGANVKCFSSPPEDAAHAEQQYTFPSPCWEVKSRSDYLRLKQELTGKLREEVLRTAFLPFTSELKQEGGSLTLIVDQELRHRAMLFSKPGARRKTVVLLVRGPVEEARKLSASFLAAGVNLLALEPTGVGSASLPKAQRPHLLRLAALTGETLTSLRVRDALGAVRALATRGEVDPQAIYLWGQGDLAVAVLYAAIVEEKVAGVLLEDSPDHHGSETALFRILRYADIPQSAALLFPRPICFLGEKAKNFGWTEEVYRLLGKARRCAASTESPAAIVTQQ